MNLKKIVGLLILLVIFSGCSKKIEDCNGVNDEVLDDSCSEVNLTWEERIFEKWGIDFNKGYTRLSENGTNVTK